MCIFEKKKNHYKYSRKNGIETLNTEMKRKFQKYELKTNGFKISEPFLLRLYYAR